MEEQNQQTQPNIPQETQPIIQPEIPQKPSMPAWAIVLITVLVIAVIGGAGYVAYQYFSPEPESESESESAQLPVSSDQESTDPTTNWQTYTNEEYGFELKYPLSWQIKQTGDDFKLNNKEKDYNLEMGLIIPISISIGNDTYNSSIDKYLTNDQIKKILKDNTVLIGGKEAYIVQGVTPPVCHDFRIIFANDKVFNINNNACGIKVVNQDDGDYVDKIFNQILSTFKFIEVDETADWQTYRNEEYGFEVKYPSDWKTLEQSFNSTSGFFGKVSITNNESLSLIDLDTPNRKAEEDELIYSIDIWKISNDEKYQDNVNYKNLGIKGDYSIFIVDDIRNSNQDEFNRILSTFKFID
ncbi:MAG: PsbP-related protein [Patescibacteria group bacterium]